MQQGQQGTVTGTQIAYAQICERKLWLYSNHIAMEKFSARVEEAKVMHELSYPQKTKELEIPGCGIKVDFCEKDGSIHEIKMSKAAEKAHVLQLGFYLKIFYEREQEVKKGVLHYPRLRQTKNVYLTKDLLREIDELIKKIKRITGSKQIPTNFPKKSFCRRCSYYPFCFS